MERLCIVYNENLKNLTNQIEIEDYDTSVYNSDAIDDEDTL